MSIVRKWHFRTTASPIDNFERHLERDELVMDQGYQRGSVWGVERKQNLIKSLLMGLPIGVIFVNDRPYPDHWAIIDGKQRILAIHGFMTDEFSVPIEWFPDDMLSPGPHEIDEVYYSELNVRGQRVFANSGTINVYWSSFSGPEMLKQEKELFDLVNFGGVPQGERDPDAKESQ